MARGVGQRVRTVVLFGSRLDCLTLSETCDAVEAMIRAHDRCHLICVKDVGLTVRCCDDGFLRRFYDRADLVLVDGRGLMLAGHLLGRPLPGRVGGPDLYSELLHRAAARDYGVYLLGARPEIVAEAARRLRARTPPLRVVGWRDGYFTGREESVVADIARTRPDILFVGISTPLRERFLDAWRDRLPPCACVPIGGVLDIEAGVIRPAPRWVSRLGLEWLFRVLQEPRRLAPRYARTHARFAVMLAAAVLRRTVGTNHGEGSQ
ncbi:MAG: glycosyltransferase [Gemmatimonadetes bacterium]|nr:MAG: glycosyltransferase [Gemmatimonadota bacterium]